MNALQLILLFVISANALIHEINFKDETRSCIFVENFGFSSSGEWKVQILVDKQKKIEEQCLKIYTVPKQTDYVQNSEPKCLNDPPNPIEFSLQKNIDEKKMITSAGFYNTFIKNDCKNPFSFKLRLEQKNMYQGNKINYLDVGKDPLPTLYAIVTLFYAASLIVWIFGFLRGPGVKVLRIHYLMTILVVLKMLTVLFKAVELHKLNQEGQAGGWAVVYYVFAFLKGIFLFVVIALIGTGWTFIKPFLSDKDRKIFLIVIPLQVLDNIALVIVEETIPASKGWFTWQDIFKIVDIICCGAILVPIIWSIKHLRDAGTTDGKAARNIQKLKLFRQFYIMVVSYIYTTRIIIYLLNASLSYQYVWLGDLSTEVATLIFFTVTGYKFRPIPDNPYFKIDEDEIIDEENSIQMDEVSEQNNKENTEG